MKQSKRMAAILGLLLFTASTLTSCSASKKGRCKECPEFTQKMDAPIIIDHVEQLEDC